MRYYKLYIDFHTEITKANHFLLFFLFLKPSYAPFLFAFVVASGGMSLDIKVMTSLANKHTFISATLPRQQ